MTFTAPVALSTMAMAPVGAHRSRSISGTGVTVALYRPMHSSSSASDMALVSGCGSHEFSISLAISCSSRSIVTYTLSPPPPSQVMSSAGHPKMAFLRSSLVFPRNENSASLSSCFFTSATTWSAGPVNCWGAEIRNGYALAFSACSGVMKSCSAIVSMTSLRRSWAVSGLRRGSYTVGLRGRTARVAASAMVS